MLGIIKKDLFMIKNNYKFLLIVLLLYVVYPIIFSVDMSYFLPFMGFIVCISTFSYDDFNNFHLYSCSFPQGRINVVKSKYIVSVCMVLFFSIVGLLLSYLLCCIKGMSFDNSISTLFGTLFGVIFMISLMYPILFKFGAEKSRFFMVFIGLLIYGVVFLVSKVIGINNLGGLISFIEKYYLILFFIISSVFIGVSYFVSRGIYLKKEF